MAHANMTIHDLYSRAVNALEVLDEVNFEAEAGADIESLMDDGTYAVDEYIRFKEMIDGKLMLAGLV